MSWIMSPVSWRRQRRKASSLPRMQPVWNLSFRIHRCVCSKAELGTGALLLREMLTANRKCIFIHALESPLGRS